MSVPGRAWGPARRARHEPGPGGRARACRWAALALAVGLAGCAGSAPPDWALDAHAAMEQAVAAALEGNARIEAVEFDRARGQIARTGRTDLLARAELMRCAAHAARLDLGPCEGFEALRVDATRADQAYADYLGGRLDPPDRALLPPAQQAAARGDAQALAGIDDPLARLVAAATLLQGGRATPAVVAQAVDTASARGWRRALLAWLQVQRRLAEQAADDALVQRIQRRIDAAGGVR